MDEQALLKKLDELLHRFDEPTEDGGDWVIRELVEVLAKQSGLDVWTKAFEISNEWDIRKAQIKRPEMTMYNELARRLQWAQALARPCTLPHARWNNWWEVQAWLQGQGYIGAHPDTKRRLLGEAYKQFREDDLTAPPLTGAQRLVVMELDKQIAALERGEVRPGF